MDFTEVFRVAMAQDGIDYSGEIIPDGELHRFYVPGDEKGSKNGCYVLFADSIPAGWYGCWKRGITKKWCSKSRTKMTAAECTEYQERMHIAKGKRDKAKAEAQAIAKVKARRLWRRARLASDEFPYLKKKGIKSHGIRCVNYSGNDVLVIPIYGADGIQSVQFIDRNGNKWFLTDGAITGGYFPIEGQLKNDSDIIAIAEGFATCSQITEIIGCNIACAFNCGNLLAVSRAIRAKHRHTQIIICADNDQWPNEEGVIDNRGLNKAREAAEAIGGKIIIPNFTGFDISTKPTDWNDLALIAGADEACRQLSVIKSRNDPKPLPAPFTKVDAFDPETLPESIRDYVIDIADRQRCPVDFVAVVAVCGLSAVLGNKIHAMPKQHDDWKVTPNLWGAIIGRPSAMKTPAMNAALEPLSRIESAAVKDYELAKKEYAVNQKLSELNESFAKNEAKKHLKSNQHDKAKESLRNASFDEPPPTRKRLIVNDSSVEKLGELLNENPNGLILVRDELSGWLSRMAKEEFQSERAFYLECYNGGGSFIYDRIGRGTIDIKNLTLSVIGGIQPSRINPLVRDSVRGVCDDGLIQRLQMAVWPNDTESWEWVDRAPDEAARTRYNEAFNTVYALGFDESFGLRFTNESQELFIKWMEEIQAIARSDDTHPALESHLLKMPETIASLALIFEILDGSRDSIGLEATAKALEWADYLKSHAERLYSAATNHGLAGAHLILKRLNKLKNEFTARDVQRKGWAGLSEPREIEDALLCLVDYGHLTRCEIPSTALGGRSSIIHIKHKKYSTEE